MINILYRYQALFTNTKKHVPRVIDSHTTANFLGPSAGNIDPEKHTIKSPLID